MVGSRALGPPALSPSAFSLPYIRVQDQAPGMVSLGFGRSWALKVQVIAGDWRESLAVRFWRGGLTMHSLSSSHPGVLPQDS